MIEQQMIKFSDLTLAQAENLNNWIVDGDLRIVCTENEKNGLYWERKKRIEILKSLYVQCLNYFEPRTNDELYELDLIFICAARIRKYQFYEIAVALRQQSYWGLNGDIESLAVEITPEIYFKAISFLNKNA